MTAPTAPTAPVSERVAAERAAYLRRLGWQGDPAVVEWVDVPAAWLEDGDGPSTYYTPAAVLALIEGSEG